MRFRTLSFAILSFSLMGLVPSGAQARWSSRSLSYADRNFGEFPGPRSLPLETRGDLATVFGGGLREVRFKEDLDSDELRVKIPQTFKKDLKVFLRKQNHVAPLLVFIPGIFSNADDGIARGTVKWFSSMGYHVLTLPNCWSEDFAKAQPIFKEEYPGGEASAVMQVTKLVIAQALGKKNISSVQIMGESLGALTASVVYAKDSRSAHPIFDGGATLTWPPIVLHEAMKKIDEMMKDTDALYTTKCHGSIKSLKTKWRILHGQYLFRPTEEEIECAPSIVAQYSFRRELVKLAKIINKTEGLGRTVPDNLDFRSFIKGYAPRYVAALSSADRYGQIQYWLQEADAQAAKNIRILTSEDDFLNQHVSWNFAGLLGPDQSQLIIAHWGGHIGLTNTKAYEGLMRTQFALH